jgi:hypothetical protein
MNKYLEVLLFWIVLLGLITLAFIGLIISATFNCIIGIIISSIFIIAYSVFLSIDIYTTKWKRKN